MQDSTTTAIPSTEQQVQYSQMQQEQPMMTMPQQPQQMDMQQQQPMTMNNNAYNPNVAIDMNMMQQHQQMNYMQPQQQQPISQDELVLQQYMLQQQMMQQQIQATQVAPPIPQQNHAVPAVQGKTELTAEQKEKKRQERNSVGCIFMVIGVLLFFLNPFLGIILVILGCVLSN